MRTAVLLLMGCLFLLVSCAALGIEDQRSPEAAYYIKRTSDNLGIGSGSSRYHPLTP